MDLAALLCSRVCHDLISPVGAIMNGLEVLDDENSGMKDFALDLIRKSAGGAAAKLKFCRLAYGAAGSSGATIDTGDAETAARELLTNEKLSVRWKGPRLMLPKNKVKLLLNLSQIAGNAIPRGGVLEVEIVGDAETATFTVAARGANPRMQAGFAELIAGKEHGVIDGHSIQPYYTALIARECGLTIEIVSEADGLVFKTSKTSAEETTAV